MKYINQLTDDELLEIIKIYEPHDIKKSKIIRNENNIEIELSIEMEDHEILGGVLNLEDTFTLTDYHVRIWDYYTNSGNILLEKYRQALLKKFGIKYAIDYLYKIN